MEDKYQVNLKTKENPDGPRLCMAEDSGKGFMEQDGLYFKDLVGDGKLYPYEDWRLTAQERAEDLASRLNVEEMLGRCSTHRSRCCRGSAIPIWEILPMVAGSIAIQTVPSLSMP